MIRKFLGSAILIGLILNTAFLILKTVNVINWDWIYVFLPLIITGGLIFIMFMYSLFVMASEVDDDRFKI